MAMRLICIIVLSNSFQSLAPLPLLYPHHASSSSTALLNVISRTQRRKKPTCPSMTKQTLASGDYSDGRGRDDERRTEVRRCDDTEQGSHRCDGAVLETHRS
uniref:Secreted protein n=1 Tax=Arachis duranensis TaxID=130453 RepID=N1NJK2_ARADU|nr:hypothetical protein ARAX_ADH51I17-83F22-007 [Arachis duranensis]